MNVAVNLLWCVPGQVGGSEQYLARQLLGLSRIDHDVLPTLYAPQGFADAHPELAAPFTIVTAPIDGHSRPRRILSEHTWLPTRTRAAAVIHHGGGVSPGRNAAPVVLTVHDLQYRTHPQYFRPLKLRYLSWAMPRSARRATIITTPTEYVRRSVIEAFGVPADRVVVVPHGVPADLGRAATEPDELRRRYTLGDGPVIVFPAMTHPHKGHEFLLRVLAERWRDPALRLVLIGGEGAHESTVRRCIVELGLSDRVVRPGRVSDADRDGLLAMAAAMVFPSEYEGFGAPVIEAMAAGAPVICSDRACLPEVAGDAAIVAPLDVDAWDAALSAAMAQRGRFVAAGRARVQRYSLEASGRALLEAYHLARR